MAHTLYEAAKASRNPLASGVLLSIATSDELLSLIQMRGTAGESISYTREKGLPNVEFVGPGGTILESSATFDDVLVPLRKITSDVDTEIFAIEQQAETQNPRATQVSLKTKSLGRKLGDKLINGTYADGVAFSPNIAGVPGGVAGPNQDTDRHGPGSIRYSNGAGTLEYRGPGDRTYGEAVDVSVDGTYVLPSDSPSKKLTVTVTAAGLPAGDVESHVRFTTSTHEFDGAARLCTAAQTILSGNPNGDALSFEVLDQLIDEKVKVQDGLVFAMPGKLIRRLRALYRGLGGTTPADVRLPGFGDRQFLSYNGIPVVKSDWIGSNESKGSATTLSSVYLISTNPEEGLSMRVGQRGGTAMADINPRTARIMGVKLRSVGELESKEAVRDRLSWYGTTRLGSELAIGRAAQIITQ